MRQEIGRYVYLLGAVAVVSFIGVVCAQEAPRADGNVVDTGVMQAQVKAVDTPPEKDAAAPSVPDAVKAKVELVKEDQKRQRDILARLQEAFNNTQAIISNDGRQLDEIGAGAVRDAKLDGAKWRLDPDKVEFARKPEPKKPDEKPGAGDAKPNAGAQK